MVESPVVERSASDYVELTLPHADYSYLKTQAVKSPLVIVFPPLLILVEGGELDALYFVRVQSVYRSSRGITVVAEKAGHLIAYAEGRDDASFDVVPQNGARTLSASNFSGHLICSDREAHEILGLIAKDKKVDLLCRMGYSS